MKHWDRLVFVYEKWIDCDRPSERHRCLNCCKNPIRLIQRFLNSPQCILLCCIYPSPVFEILLPQNIAKSCIIWYCYRRITRLNTVTCYAQTLCTRNPHRPNSSSSSKNKKTKIPLECYAKVAINANGKSGNIKPRVKEPENKVLDQKSV